MRSRPRSGPSCEGLPALRVPHDDRPVHDTRWDFGLRCDPSCKTFAEPQLAHRIAERAAEATGQRLRYEAFDTSTGRIEGAVRALAGR